MSLNFACIIIHFFIPGDNGYDCMAIIVSLVSHIIDALIKFLTVVFTIFFSRF